MKTSIRFFALLLLLSCHEEENYSIEPVITLVDVSFDDSIETWEFDTISVALSFTDGDGDLGLDYQNNPSDTLYPRHRRNFFLKATGEQVPSDDLFLGNVAIDDLIHLSDLQNPPYDTLAKTYSACYSFGSGDQDRPFWIRNEDHYNILVDFLFEDPNGHFVEFDFYKAFCTTFDGIFPERPGEDGPFILALDRLNRGQLTYRMTSVGFKSIFEEKRLKLRIQIKDKAMHNSNIIETPSFILKEF